ncbi:4'-phosphopantetheinyl transferase family protein [Mycetocola reblochoni]|uniref:4'-phosphopantetheinyl transferase superfamily protein n=1 Tax=Mycetocola reblochoni TaxID=331618 RepID=A0A3L6ZLP3_9MICO|nr:4'-phosphopantetheinyl transferase superfamily protein [Mycetocola reblochoni]RLP68753.1 4'-phosphopantetheinyl transferase superfamily protein [Mycetocola reblochoni]
MMSPVLGVSVALPVAVRIPGPIRTVEARVEITDRLVDAEPPRWLPLTDDDRARLAAFRREEDARRFLTGRFLVHRRLHEEWGVPLGGARFARRFTAAGEWKPILSAEPGRGWAGAAWPDVSISHSGAFVAAAFCEEAEVGIDIEQHSSFVDADDMLALALTPAERARVSSIADAARAFTAKEAVLKAVGFGLAIDPLRVEILDGAVRRFDHVERRPVALAPVPVSVSASALVSATVAIAPRVSVG